MTDFMHHTMADIRGGRQTWRVILTLCIPSLAISLATSLAL
ncbi:MAG TPA: hypothetical protein VGR02_09815 [Thermoanaerobaculia bacterium]|jgi:hypothetical protein|nr:hypothetical protein [Thermoanaerobaculia bacterium]